MPDPDKKIPGPSPEITYLINKIAGFYFSKRKKEKHEHKYNYHQYDKYQQCIDAIKNLEKAKK
jgi:hypothetical protein